MLAKDYPYTGEDEICKYDESKAVGGVLGSFNITELDEFSLKQAIAKVGPVAVAYDCDDEFEDYESGVYSSKTCQSKKTDVNHAVQAVGYGTENGKDYWLCKNSWSEEWGDKGYFKIERGVNMCGIAVCNSFPVGVHTYSH